jgi:uncharacterized protein
MMHGTIDETYKEEIELIVNQLTNKFDINKIILFGSLARGDYNEKSDIDLCIVFNKMPHEDHENCISDIYLSITNRKIPADFVVTDLLEYEVEINDEYSLFARNIEKQGVIVYGQ